MKPFHFYVDSDEIQSNGFYTLLFPYCRSSKGYGIFYFLLNKSEEISSIDFLGKSIHMYFENNKDSIKHYDEDMGRWGINKLKELPKPEYIKTTIIEIFNNDSLLDSIKTWSIK